MLGLGFGFMHGKGALSNTMNLLGLPSQSTKLKILSYAPPNNSAAASKTHEATNFRLQQSLESNSLGQATHITGRMSALHDPFHSTLCVNIAKRYNDPFQFSYVDRDDPDDSALNIIKQKQMMWGHFGLDNILSSLGKEAKAQVQVFSLKEKPEVEYSVFGQRFVLLQSPHDEKIQNDPKHIWLIDSEDLYGSLCEKAVSQVMAGNEVPSHLFEQAIDLIGGLGAQAVLKNLDVGTEMEEVRLTKLGLSDFSQSPSSVLMALSTLELITDVGTNVWSLTPLGLQFREENGWRR